MPSDRWAKHDSAMGELYERVEREKAEKEAAEAEAEAHFIANAEAERQRYLANPATSSETTLVAGSGTQPTQSIATHRHRAADDSAKASSAWDRYLRWSAKYYKTNLYDRPKPGAQPPS